MIIHIDALVVSPLSVGVICVVVNSNVQLEIIRIMCCSGWLVSGSIPFWGCRSLVVNSSVGSFGSFGHLCLLIVVLVVDPLDHLFIPSCRLDL